MVFSFILFGFKFVKVVVYCFVFFFVFRRLIKFNFRVCCLVKIFLLVNFLIFFIVKLCFVVIVEINCLQLLLIKVCKIDCFFGSNFWLKDKMFLQGLDLIILKEIFIFFSNFFRLLFCKIMLILLVMVLEFVMMWG